MQLIKMMMAILLLASVAVPSVASDDVHVDGYYRKDGTYVREHYRSAPDGNPYNNKSYRGN